MLYSIYKLTLCVFSLISAIAINAQESEQSSEPSKDERIIFTAGQAIVDSVPGAKRIVVHLMDMELTDDTIRMIVPTYRFKNDVTGNFLRQLNDSIAECDDSSWRVMGHSKSTHRDVISSVYMKSEYFDNITGVIYGHPHGVTAIYSDSPTWIEHMHLEKAGVNTIIQIQPISFSLEDSVWPMVCCFFIEKSGRVKISSITYGYDFKDINEYVKSRPEFIKRFEWIRDYYKKHGFSTKLDFLGE